MRFRRWYNAQKVGVQVAVVSGFVALGCAVIAGIFGIIDVELAKSSSQASAPAPTSATATSAPFTSAPTASTASATTAPPAISVTPTATSITSATTALPTGTFADPPNGATNVSYHEQLHVSGTARNIPEGYKLDVFLQFAGQQRYYSAGDPRTAAPLTGGHWSATIYIGDSGAITLWLVSLSPAEADLMNSEVAYQSAGYPTLPGARLASVSFTANPPS
jgi:hypothetical protein